MDMRAEGEPPAPCLPAVTRLARPRRVVDGGYWIVQTTVPLQLVEL